VYGLEALVVVCRLSPLFMLTKNLTMPLRFAGKSKNEFYAPALEKL
jgi:hypothetical protein